MNRAALLTKLNKSGFLTHAAENDHVLVHPARNKYEWAEEELRFRSAVLDADGSIVSVGWPKFFNQGEWPAHDSVIARELASGKAVITHKHDGSLLIRSVLSDGQILLRTRGSYDGGEYGRAAELVAQAKYPALLDPTLFPHGSLLFEYVGKANQIVVRYEGEDDLIFLGAVAHNPFRYFSFAELKSLAVQLDLRLVETYDWAKTGAINEVLSLVQEWNHAEGVVVRSGDGQILLKIKSAWYFAQHALRWHVRLPTIARFCIDGGITDEPTFMQKLTEIGWDYETATVARGYFQTYLERRTEAEAIKQKALAFLATFDTETGETFPDERARRKAFAARVFAANASQDVRSMSAYLFDVYDGKISQMEAKLLQRLILNVSSG